MRALLAAADALKRDTMRDAFASVGCEVRIVDGVDAVLDAIARESPDLVVFDEHPDVSMVDLCRRVRALPDGGPFVLALTRDVDDERLALLLDAGADDYLLVAPGDPVLEGRARARARVVTRRVDERLARRRAEGTLERTERLLGVGDAVSAGLQHEINNPLAALLAHASLLEQGLHEPGEERELLGVIVEQAHRIADVVRRIAALRYPEDSEFVPDDFADR
ncbi:histidine kinase A domain protein [Gemmatirosa kalamazoonensis]|uniref:histidine kinase n=1 Tax=Gemmatirosa kalamazoonensis TaxID=861299 RepID=W0RER6_9BACT|nr:response regulator [Gemmatirosa kalamazoonensis]AHG89599.1 histidine kinase A domain protein [Gemmatirosa kalamazoonensis]